MLIYETADGHNHWHLRAAMRYALFNEVRSAEVAPAQEVGFCLIDSEHVNASGPSNAVYLLGTFCERNNPNAATVSMGISPGWRDKYGSTLAFQWVDVSDVQRIHSGLGVTGIRIVAKLFVGRKAVATRQATFARQLAVYRSTGLECWLSVPLRRSAG